MRLALLVLALSGLAHAEVSPSLRAGLGVSPLVGYSGRTFFLHQVHTPASGSWTTVDIAPGVHVSRFFTVELALSLMLPIQDAWGFPDARLAVTPTIRLDAAWFYARAGVQFMFGQSVKYGAQVALGANIWKLYVGLLTLATTDFVAGLGLEVGAHFDKLFSLQRR